MGALTPCLTSFYHRSMQRLIRTTSRWGLPLAMVATLLSAGCTESSVASLQGRWDGEIRCSGGFRKLSISFEIQGESIGGEAFITHQGVRGEWSIAGDQVNCWRYVHCSDDSCDGPGDDKTCSALHYSKPFPDEGKLELDPSQEPDPKKKAAMEAEIEATQKAVEATYGPQCPVAVEINTPREVERTSRCSSRARCTPCLQRQSYRRVLLTLDDGSGGSDKPMLDLARGGETRLSGTARNYCAQVGLADPVVELVRAER